MNDRTCEMNDRTCVVNDRRVKSRNATAKCGATTPKSPLASEVREPGVEMIAAKVEGANAITEV